jgi:hypothetical protein
MSIQETYTFKKGDLIGTEAAEHDKEFLEAKCPQYLDDKKFFPYKNTDCYWETFTMNEMVDLAQKTGFTVMECKRGMVHNEEDGHILHCLYRKSENKVLS